MRKPTDADGGIVGEHFLVVVPNELLVDVRAVLANIFQYRLVNVAYSYLEIIQIKK